jgi:hypothetical protein
MGFFESRSSRTEISGRILRKLCEWHWQSQDLLQNALRTLSEVGDLIRKGKYVDASSDWEIIEKQKSSTTSKCFDLALDQKQTVLIWEWLKSHGRKRSGGV